MPLDPRPPMAVFQPEVPADVRKRLAELEATAIATFGNRVDAIQWMTRYHTAFRGGKERPDDAARENDAGLAEALAFLASLNVTPRPSAEQPWVGKPGRRRR